MARKVAGSSTDVAGSSKNKTVTLNAGTNIVGSLHVNWGDGITNTWPAGASVGSHTYARTGIYPITVNDDGTRVGRVDVLATQSPVITGTDPLSVQTVVGMQTIRVFGMDFDPNISEVYLIGDSPESIGQRLMDFTKSTDPFKEFRFDLSETDVAGKQVINIVVRNGDVDSPVFALPANDSMPVGASEDDLLRWVGTNLVRAQKVLTQELGTASPRVSLVQDLQRLLGITVTTPKPAIASVSAGSPGIWVPADGNIPTSLLELRQHQTVGDSGSSPQTALWVENDYVMLADGTTEVHWDNYNKTWELEKVPAPKYIENVVVGAGSPGRFEPLDNTDHIHDLVALNAHRNIGIGQAGAPVSAWFVGEWIVLGDHSEAHWSGARWDVGQGTVPVPVPVTGVTEGAGVHTWLPADANQEFADIAEVEAVTALSKATRVAAHLVTWGKGDYLQLNQTTKISWNGTEWVLGAIPNPVMEFTIVDGVNDYAWIPVNATNIPQTLADLIGDSNVGNTSGSGHDWPAWKDDQYIVLGDGSMASWNGLEWVVGMSEPMSGVLPGTPGVFEPSGANNIPRSLVGMTNDLVVGNTAMHHLGPWAVGEYVTVGKVKTEVYWSGPDTGWMAGKAPAPAPAP